MYGSIGTVSHGTMRTEDLIPTFAEELKSLDEDREYADLVIQAEAVTDYDCEASFYLLEELFDILGNFAPPYFYFGEHPGDGSDYGFWIIEDFQQDFDGLKVADLSEVPDAYEGEVLHVNDHGNTSLYVADKGKLKEIRSVV